MHSSGERSVLNVVELSVSFAGRAVVDRVSLALQAGRVTAVVGESGSGKSQLALALTGLSDGVVTGRVALGRQMISALAEGQLRRVRGRRVGYVFQDPLSALHPYLRLSVQLAEVARTHLGVSRRAAEARAATMLARVQLAPAERFLEAFPHELSGGQRQRAMIAVALMALPEVLVADEPTTALDATIQIEILDLIRGLCRTERLACLLITHDMGVVARIADEVLVMRAGRAVERGPVGRIFAAPEAAYTRELIAATPRIDAAVDRQDVPEAPLLAVRGLSVRYPAGGVFRRAAPVEAVRDLAFHVSAGETLGVVGESGSGKSSAARALLRLAPLSAGAVLWRGRDVTRLPDSAFRVVRREMQMVFQDPHASLDPRMRVRQTIAEPLLTHLPEMPAGERRRKVAEALSLVRLPDALAERFPHELSGGQAQRVGIARALVSGPRLLICDEAVSALDVSVQARVLGLLADLQERLGLALLFISHDLAVVRQISHRVIVMRAGELCETVSGSGLLAARHPYTRKLLAAALRAPSPPDGWTAAPRLP